MATLNIQHVDKIYDNNVQAVFDFNLDVKDGELIVLVGPSGCGKSTTLRMIAGLEDISAGKLLLDGKDITSAPAKDRDMAMVFQNYALYGHMTIYENMAFSLTLRKENPNVIHKKVLAAAEILGLTSQLNKKPSQLSGGQRQRVAMGRSIVRNPKVFLFDEPLSNLDAKLRGATRREILLLHKRLKATMLYVTHDQTEALTLADRIVCMSMGHVQQVGTPIELYDKPANKFVASFIGLPPMNFFDVTVRADHLEGKGFTVPLTAEEKAVLAPYAGKEIDLGVRPEDVQAGGDIAMTVYSNENLGMNTLVHGHIGHSEAASNKISAKLRGWCDYKEGDNISVSFSRKHFFDKETGVAIRKEENA
ncbi:MAG: sn-glycerol-3-phosphate ABC transporter ATP-binding protein UgpC [Oscillospiraceae bacterium]|nr:sn-glycerol-3-phosphate ABC transporter ATP-binding protein UgpC [Oscillospiraceae bacterium]MBR0210813.1 sn-glycerol-3-phosphate ABC transporter ATP-binding protein UgpC [Oscillospiraceae bacterium]MBR0211234.1 sn-glycerol-3-phosphate ABC transporter ATP-binding protein UgpC [Oscillospiraceae bacterium]